MLADKEQDYRERGTGHTKKAIVKSWMCHQLGSREHYSIPRALHAGGRLQSFITDAWLPPFWGKVSRRGGLPSLAGRYHQDLASATVRAFTVSRLLFDIWAKIWRMRHWEAIVHRNKWFQGRAERVLEGMAEIGWGEIIFSYSYTARHLFHWAGRNGRLCVLGQIDPGPEEHRWVNDRVSEYSLDATENTSGPPHEYWQSWREEVELADCILVNSEWSKQLLEQGGVPERKMKIIPLAYERSMTQCAAESKEYPRVFDVRRPLKVLFLGQVIHRKGVLPLLEGADRLRDEPVEFLMAGPDPEGLLDHHEDNPGIRALGAVDRMRAEQLYAEADVFILPTFSDGFAITQLEAAAHRLPLIVSRYCGEVVESGKNGWVLPEVSADAIVEVLKECLANPAQLEAYSAFEMDWARFSLEALGRNLQEAEIQAREYSRRRKIEEESEIT